MELRINISKVHLFVFIGVLVLFGALMFVIAQTPNPGHDVKDINFNEAPTIKSQYSDFLIVESNDARSWVNIYSNKPSFGVWDGINNRWADFNVRDVYARDVYAGGQQVCRKDGTNCPARIGTKQIVARPGVSRFIDKIIFQPPCPTKNYVAELATDWWNSHTYGAFSYVPFKGITSTDNFEILLVEISGKNAPTGAFDPVWIEVDYTIYCK